MERLPSNNKRRGDLMQNDVSKQKREESSTPSINSTKITDVNQFCLEKIVTYLDLKDLLSLADANKYLQIATRSPYSRQYAKENIHIMLRNDCFGDNDENQPQNGILNANITFENATMYIKDLKTALQMLRCFGHVFDNISLQCFESCPNFEIVNYLTSYVNEFCAESLTKFSMLPLDEIENLEKPFSNIESVELGNSLSKNFNLNKTFPKLRRLICSKYCIPKSIAPAMHFPNLEHLEFSHHLAVYIDTNKQTIADILRMNPQLRSFSIAFNNINVLKFITEYLQSIEILNISMITNFCKGDLMRFSNVKSLTIKFGDAMKMNFPFSADQLKEFTIKGKCLWNDSFFDFIKRHRSVEKLSIKTYYAISEENSLKLMELLPTLQSINIHIQSVNLVSAIKYVMSYFPIFENIASFIFTFSYFTNESHAREIFGDYFHVIYVKSGEYSHLTLKPIETICFNDFISKVFDFFGQP